LHSPQRKLWQSLSTVGPIFQDNEGADHFRPQSTDSSWCPGWGNRSSGLGIGVQIDHKQMEWFLTSSTSLGFSSEVDECRLIDIAKETGELRMWSDNFVRGNSALSRYPSRNQA
jgi:hypothetical protein